jgi:hypothetical protein
VNEDTNIEPLREAYLSFKQQIDPFKISKTAKGIPCLVLNNAEEEPRPLFIYRIKD